MHGALHEPLRFELAQPPGQKPVGEAGHDLGQLGVVVGALRQGPEDRAGPSLADEFDRLMEIRGHARRLSARPWSTAFGLRRPCLHPRMRVQKDPGGHFRTHRSAAQGPVVLERSGPERARPTMSLGPPRPPGGPLSWADAKTVVRTWPDPSTTGPPEFPLLTSPRNGVIWR